MRAYRQVVSNKGSAGVDGMPVRELYKYLTNNRERIETELRQGKYLPRAILGVEIPKSNGKIRLPGIPTVVDRLLQQAVSVLQQSVNMHLCETETGLGGYLFREIRRPGKDGHQTSIVTTHPTLATNLIAGRMFARWCRENFFRYLDYGL